MSAGIYRASQSAARAAAVDPSMASPADQPSAPSASTQGAGTTGEGEMPSIGDALLAFRCVIWWRMVRFANVPISHVIHDF